MVVQNWMKPWLQPSMAPCSRTASQLGIGWYVFLMFSFTVLPTVPCRVVNPGSIPKFEQVKNRYLRRDTDSVDPSISTKQSSLLNLTTEAWCLCFLPSPCTFSPLYTPAFSTYSVPIKIRKPTPTPSLRPRTTLSENFSTSHGNVCPRGSPTTTSPRGALILGHPYLRGDILQGLKVRPRGVISDCQDALHN